MKQALLSWIGQADINGSTPTGARKFGEGPLVSALKKYEYDHVRLLLNYEDADKAFLTGWFKKHTKAKVEVIRIKLKDPTDFDTIYKASVSNIEGFTSKHPDHHLTIHLSPGTPAMQSVWILLSKTRFAANLIQSSKQQGVRRASVPFDISAEYIPDLLRTSGERLTDQLSRKPKPAGGFEAITYRSPIMQRLIGRAQKIAQHSVPVLIEGDSGTGKELLAHSIHKTSLRSDKPFITVNCGSIPSNLGESQLFGHKKGAFTDAIEDHAGFFEAADTGSIFLDEVGELESSTQVKLLRVLQEKEFTPLGASKPKRVDVRIISATNRSLIKEVGEGKFREDLFYRLAVATLNLPPVREREGDLALLIDTLMDSVQSDILDLPIEKHKKLSVKAKNILLNHDWPGNVRELQNTIARAVLWSDGDSISEQDARGAILVGHSGAIRDLMNLLMDDEFNLQTLLEKVEKHYVQRALEEAHWKKAPAARKLGMKNYQNLTLKMKKYGIE